MRDPRRLVLLPHDATQASSDGSKSCRTPAAITTRVAAMLESPRTSGDH